MSEDAIRPALIKGLLITAGCLSESHSRAAKSCLLSYIESKVNSKSVDQDFLLILDAALELIRKSSKFESRWVSLMRALAFLLLEIPISIQIPCSWVIPFCERVQHDFKTSKSPSRLAVNAKALVGVAAYHVSAWRDFALYLTHEFPSVRKQAAESFYLWGISVMSPAESPFELYGGDLNNALAFVSTSLSLIEGEITLEALLKIRTEFLTYCPACINPDTQVPCCCQYS